jgi:O-methyltransferase involved in polyketide biosynthesis
MDVKEKITLSEERETLLIPLYAKAQENPILNDEKARQILESLQYDFRRLKIPHKTEVTLRIRAKQLDAYTRQFITAHPNALILHLGCGLDSRCLRVPRAGSFWFDLDLPEVIELRRKFYPETESYRLIASSVTELAWMEQISPEGRPVFVVAEGLLMYLPESRVRELILTLHARFPGCSLVFDAFSKLTADRVQAHPSLQKTGAAIHWGIDDPHEIERWAGDGEPGIRLKEEWFFNQSPDIDRLNVFYRLMFRLAGAIPAAQRAQRLLYYTL